jgi:sentrin-specific protease 1
LLNARQEKKRLKDVYFFEKNIFSFILNKDQYAIEKNARMFKTVNIFDYSRVEFYCCKDSNHLTFVQVDFMHNNIKFHDSLYDGNKEFGLKALNDFAEIINYIQAQKRIGITMFNLLIDSDTPKQHNGYDCGIFVCMYAHDIESIGKINESTCIQKNTSYFRLYMLFQFIQEINNIEIAKKSNNTINLIVNDEKLSSQRVS